MKSVFTISALLLVAFCAPPLAVAQDEAVVIEGAHVVTMTDVAGVLSHRDRSLVAERSGRVFSWDEGVPVRWTALEGPILGVAAAGDNAIVFSRAGYTVLDWDTLETLDSGGFEGLALCAGGDAAWFWDYEGEEIWLASRRGIEEFPVDLVPYSRANCSATPNEFALVWDDGIDAALLDSRGGFQIAEWTSNGLPVAAWGGEWHITLPSPWSATSTCDDVTLASGGCAELTHDSLRQFLGPARPQIEDARIVRNGLVVQDPAGWTIVVPQSPPLSIRFSGNTIGLSDGPEPAALVCTGLEPRRLIARDVLTGADLDSVEVSRCPDSLRRVSGRILIDAGAELVVWNEVSREFISQTVDQVSAYSIDTEWSSACAGPAWTVRSPRGRWLGPSCEPLSAVDIRSGGAQAGVAVCRNEQLLTAFRLDGAGTSTEDLIGSCEDAFTTVTIEPTRAGESGPLRIAGSSLFVDLGDSELQFEFAGRDFLVHDGARLWASDTLWDRVIWAAEGDLRTLRDRRSQDVWDPDILRDASRQWN